MIYLGDLKVRAAKSAHYSGNAGLHLCSSSIFTRSDFPSERYLLEAGDKSAMAPKLRVGW
jgi:hypothetical protein